MQQNSRVSVLIAGALLLGLCLPLASHASPNMSSGTKKPSSTKTPPRTNPPSGTNVFTPHSHTHNPPIDPPHHLPPNIWTRPGGWYQQPQVPLALPTNTLPANTPVPQIEVKPPANTIPMEATTPDPNTGLNGQVVSLQPEDVAAMKNQLIQRNGELLNAIEEGIMQAVHELIAKLPGAGKRTPEDKQRITDAIRNGDPEGLKGLLGEEGLKSPAGQALVNRATAQQLLNGITEAIRGGQLTGGNLGNLVDGLRGALGGNININVNVNLTNIIDVISQIAINQQLINWINNWIATTTIPIDDGPIVLVGGFDPGIIGPFGTGPTLIGVGPMDPPILLGEGNVAEVAGVGVAAGAPVDEASEELSATDIILTNVGSSAVSYNLNRQSFTMAPKFTQTLSGSQPWTVEFDRGGGKGTAQYGLTPGVYGFTPTVTGWELFKKTIRVKVDNSSNPFAFSYVLDNQSHSLPPRQIQELTSPLPMLLKFENGAGQYKQKRLDSGTYRVAVSRDNTLDLFSADSVSTPQAVSAGSPAKAGTSSTGSADKGSAASSPQRLPPGFKLFDAADALTHRDPAKRIPPAFDLFRTANAVPMKK
jgi:hypothetical protein